LHSGLGSTGLNLSIGTGLGTGFGGSSLAGGSGLGANSLGGGAGLAGGGLGVGASLGAAGLTGGSAIGSGSLGAGPGLGVGSLVGGPSLGADSLGGSRGLGTSGLSGVPGLGTVGSGLSLPSRGAPSLGVLSAQAALAQQSTAMRPGLYHCSDNVVVLGCRSHCFYVKTQQQTAVNLILPSYGGCNVQYVALRSD